MADQPADPVTKEPVPENLGDHIIFLSVYALGPLILLGVIVILASLDGWVFRLLHH
ncbi:MAG: hypothetical protein JO112_14345 [Planctomycetes bacterium]|nr:hypothetical protein [Planctomycetota bacterium]